MAKNCSPVSTYTAYRIVESLIWYPGTSPTSPLNDRPDPFDIYALGSLPDNEQGVYFENHYKVPLRHPHGSKTRWAAFYVLDKLDIDHDIEGPDDIRVKYGTHYISVLVTYNSLQDVSVAGRRYLIRFYYLTQQRYGSVPYWRFSSLGVQYRCQPGQGPQNWSKERCT